MPALKTFVIYIGMRLSARRRPDELHSTSHNINEPKGPADKLLFLSVHSQGIMCIWIVQAANVQPHTSFDYYNVCACVFINNLNEWTDA